ncbi:hypothetical protein [Lentibacillus salinarum]|uniref:Uncharacterized protein n=1 Tax=Lentibacillus salinarum TaxID=446820 RepID=A0ABW3ZVT4_9BACI
MRIFLWEIFCGGCGAGARWGASWCGGAVYVGADLALCYAAAGCGGQEATGGRRLCADGVLAGSERVGAVALYGGRSASIMVGAAAGGGAAGLGCAVYVGDSGFVRWSVPAGRGARAG